MKTKLSMVLGAAVLLAAWGGQALAACDPQQVVKDVLAADETRYRAMVANDFATLESTLGDDLVYTHSSAVVDTKASYVDSLRSGKVKYNQTDRSDVKVSAYGCMAIVSGRGDFKVNVGGKDLDVQLRFTNVWEQRRSGWQMIAWQATRIPPQQ